MKPAIELEVVTSVYGSEKQSESSVIAFPSFQLPLRDIISLKVRAEIERELRRQEQKPPPALSLLYLIDDSISWAKEGAIPKPRPRKIDVRNEIERALKAFTDGKYFVMINCVRAADLEEMVDLNPETRIQFIKLVPLTGGSC